MNQPLYHRPDVELPYNIDTRYFKSIQQGKVKEKYECRWVVLTQEVNSFIQGIPNSFNGLALSSVNRDDRGPITVLTINYGDNELSQDYDGDGQITWWTFGGSVYSFHIKRWVENTPEKIKEFIQHCLTGYGYDKEQVTVNCNPIAGEPRVMAEATFTPRNVDEWGNNAGNQFNEEEADQDGMTEQGQSIQFDSTMDSMTVPIYKYLAKVMNTQTYKINDYMLPLINRIDNGELVYKKKGHYGGELPPYSGWYLSDDNPQALNGIPQYYDGDQGGLLTPDNVAKCKTAMQSVPDATFISIKVTATSKVKSKDKLSYKKLSKKFAQTGKIQSGYLSEATENDMKQDLIDQSLFVERYPDRYDDHSGQMVKTGGLYLNPDKSPSINVGGSKMTIPQSCWIARDTVGYTYPLECSWINEGVSFDASRTKSKVSTNRTVYYQGSLVRSYRTISRFWSGDVCNNGTGAQ